MEAVGMSWICIRTREQNKGTSENYNKTVSNCVFVGGGGWVMLQPDLSVPPGDQQETP